MEFDWILIHNMRQGNEDSWEQFLAKYYGCILKYCQFHCIDRNAAEDLTQEVFLRFFANLSEYRYMGKTKNYLYTIARNLCIKENGCLRPLPLEGAAAAASEQDERIALEMAIRSLPGEIQEVMVLHYYQGLALREVAALLDIGLPLVKYRLKRGKELLRKELEDEIE